MSKSVKRLLGLMKKAKIVFCGLDYAGKTSLVNYLKVGHLTITIPTFGLNLETLEYGNVEFQISDLGGHQDFRGFWKNFITGSDVIVFVIDSNDTNRLSESKQAFKDVLNCTDEIKPILVLSNKQDLPNCVKMSELVEYFELQQLDGSWHIQETSSITGQGITEAFQWIYEHLTSQKIDPPLQIFELGIRDTQQNQTWCRVFEEKGRDSDFAKLFDLLFPEIRKHHFETIHLKNRKVVIVEYKLCLSYLVIRKTDSEPLAQSLLQQLLEEITVSSETNETLVKIALDSGAYGAKLTGTGRGGNI
ncbi:MAG: ADP-ribosylation factor-like protein, partial [Candidatus Hodarchaeota archaeon]